MYCSFYCSMQQKLEWLAKIYGECWFHSEHTNQQALGGVSPVHFHEFFCSESLLLTSRKTKVDHRYKRTNATLVISICTTVQHSGIDAMMTRKATS